MHKVDESFLSYDSSFAASRSPEIKKIRQVLEPFRSFGLSHTVGCHPYALVCTDSNVAQLASGGAWICDCCGGKFEGRFILFGFRLA